jgi:type I restriction enzyme M protein
MFYKWLLSETLSPYNSFGNGAAMRVSACWFAAKSVEEAVMLSKKVTEVTHNPEGLKGAEAAAVSIFLAREKCSFVLLKYGSILKKITIP